MSDLARTVRTTGHAGPTSTNDVVKIASAKIAVAANSIRSLRRQSKLKSAFIITFGLTFLVGLYLMFLGAFRYASDFLPGAPRLLAGYIFGLLFAALAVMLTFSNAIIMYSALYRGRESRFLMAFPLRYKDIFLNKLGESVLFSSWAFLFISGPVIFAFGAHEQAPWYFYPMALAAFVPFAMIPASFGSIAVMLLGRFLPRSRRTIILIAVLVILLVAAGILWVLADVRQGRALAGTDRWVAFTLSKLSFARNALLPSQWLSSYVLGAANRATPEVFLHLALIVANALFWSMAAYDLAGLIYASSFDRVSSGIRRARRTSRRAVPRFVLSGWKTLVLLQKDITSFRRDPAQYSQMLIFFGILGVYFLSLPHLAYDLDNPVWQNIIATLNLAATCMTLATFTSRFIFPLVSLEGQKFWILGLAPVRRRSVLISKVAFAAAGSLAMSFFLIGISDHMLRVPWSMRLVHMATLVIVCVGLSSISVGLGARFMNLKEDNPSKIVTGFGGTLNLIVSLVFLVMVLVCVAVPGAMYVGKRIATMDFLAVQTPEAGGFANAILVGLGAAFAVGVVATAASLTVGARAFDRAEF